jgi:hypothetical protein
MTGLVSKLLVTSGQSVSYRRVIWQGGFIYSLVFFPTFARMLSAEYRHTINRVIVQLCVCLYPEKKAVPE